MSLNLNPNFPTYRDKVGQYVEVLGVVGNKIVLTYPEENIDTVEYDNASNLKVGQRIYFGPDGEYDPKLKAEVIETVCQGCGLCNATCPQGAVQLSHFTDNQILAEVEALCQF